jgi:hypothetical protein
MKEISVKIIEKMFISVIEKTEGFKKYVRWSKV